MVKSFVGNMDSILYVQIWEKRIKVTDIQTGEVYDEVPLVSIQKNKKGQEIISAVGNKAKLMRSDGNEAINPFSHPRGLVSDFILAEKFFQHAFKELLGRKAFSPSPKVVIHPMEKTDGGITMIENKAFTEMALGAGAREVVIHQGSVLGSSAFDFNKIKKDNEGNLPSYSRIKPDKEKYSMLVLWVSIAAMVFWLTNVS
ncbi:rod shape-determining protein [Aestuariirhabdus sp. Z084]|uniref:rod shape-determining protein n=1 Tax=Aestuariirhabdus haliotis TaxID=2918751 RepID=UPI00201B4261|nr:rod shape-determining protein [Aestuariirhabdus haliotis]MCL6417080.1 rod shape-determining protein [Aestuariirhabdus haliotis]MCL6420991.1 rod shape-determining protein [Aestuariirhabdus haliotis]